MKVQLAAVAILSATSGFANADSVCDRLTSAVILEQKTTAQNFAGQVGDDSVYRAMLVELRTNNQLLMMQMNLTLMIQAHCPLPGHPLTPGPFIADALTCNLAVLKGADINKTPECDFSKWIPKY